MKFKTSILIKAPVEHVWTYIEDFEKQKQWMRGLVDIKRIDDVKSIVYLKEGRKTNPYNIKVLHSKPPSRLHVLMFDDKKKFEGTSDYNLSQEGEFTKLDYLCDMQVNSFFMKIMMFTIGGIFSKIMMNSFFKKMKQVTEASYTK